MTPSEMLPGFKREPLSEATPGSKRTAVEVPKLPSLAELDRLLCTLQNDN